MASPSFLVLGSGGSEGIPAYFCDCRVCREAAAKGGREIRGRTSYNFGGSVQIDYGPDMLQAFQRYYPRLNGMKHVLITHAHEDHLAPEEFWFRIRGCSHIPVGAPRLHVHASAPSLARLMRDIAPTMGSFTRRARICDDALLDLHEIAPFETFTLPDVDATVRTFKAAHAQDLIPLLFIITMGGRSVFICNDTGRLPKDTVDALARLSGKVHLDVAVFDCTSGTKTLWPDSHMGADEALRTSLVLEELGLIDNDTVKILNHFSHNAGLTHEELCAQLEPRGFIIGYDGLEV